MEESSHAHIRGHGYAASSSPLLTRYCGNRRRAEHEGGPRRTKLVMLVSWQLPWCNHRHPCGAPTLACATGDKRAASNTQSEGEQTLKHEPRTTMGTHRRSCGVGKGPCMRARAKGGNCSPAVSRLRQLHAEAVPTHTHTFLSTSRSNPMCTYPNLGQAPRGRYQERYGRYAR
jgi:hypothetical protein